VYNIQSQAPSPKPLLRTTNLIECPEYYGLEYHGQIDHKEAEKLLHNSPDGTYMIRTSPGVTEFNTLCIRFDGKTKNFRLYYSAPLGHFLKEDLKPKRFEKVEDLVADGLVSFYMLKHAKTIIQEIMTPTPKNYQESPYLTLNKRKLCQIAKQFKQSLETEETASTSVSETDSLPVYEKKHSFKSHNFKGFNWCELCANFLWGFTAQGVKCEDCGFVAHFKCSEQVPAKCVPDLKEMRGVFGVDLTTLSIRYKCSIPFVVKMCVEEIEKRGMMHEGIYRISAFADEIETLKMALDREGDKAVMSENVYSINVVAGALKLYLRLLPVPLITFQADPTFIRVMECKSIGEQIIAIREALKELPAAHLNCLKYILEHLHRVAAHQAVNKMTEHNLATVFATSHRI
jgi:hypothetical protein